MRNNRNPEPPSPPAEPTCAACGAPLESAQQCAYDEPEERAPWRGDYDAMSKGLMTHEEHALIVARWGLHNRDRQSAVALARFESLTRAARGRKLQLFPLDE